MDLQMNGKAALVTGASVGIGKAIAFALAREGVDVAICARRREPLEAAASQIARETNRKIVAIPADLTKPADAEACGKEAHNQARGDRLERLVPRNLGPSGVRITLGPGSLQRMAEAIRRIDDLRRGVALDANAAVGVLGIGRHLGEAPILDHRD